MGRQNNGDLTSFELLLDTMCNTFGGIVFIALLLTILSQAIEVDHPIDAQFPGSFPLSQLPGDYSLSKLQHLNLMKIHREELAKTLESDKKSIFRAKERITALKKKLESLNLEIEALQNEKKMAIRFPRLHTVEKKPFFIAIEQGRLYLISDVSAPFSGHRGYNLSDVRVWKYGKLITIDLIPEKGQIIEPGAEKTGKLGKALDNIDPLREFISFAVFPDSFREFNEIKSIFLENGYDYNWLIIREREDITIVSEKGRGGMRVQ